MMNYLNIVMIIRKYIYIHILYMNLKYIYDDEPVLCYGGSGSMNLYL